MKKIYLLIILLFSGFGFGQVSLTGNAAYALKIRGEVGADGSPCGSNITRGLQWVASIDKNSIAKTIVQGSASYPDTGHGLTAQNYDPAIVYFKEDEEIKEFRIRTTKRDSGTGGKCKDVQYSDASIFVTTDIYNKYFDFADLSLNQTGNIHVSIYPIVNLVNPNVLNNIIGSDTSIEIPEITGVKNSYFKWMYHIEGEQEYIKVGLSWSWEDKWRNLPDTYQGDNKLNIKCKDFLPYEAIGKKIWLRANPNGSTVELLYVKSAPHILSVDPVQTSCFDSKDGKVKINFSRPLDVGEILSLDFDGVNQIDVSNITKDGILEGKKLEDDNSFTVENLSKGLTTLKLTGYFQQDVYKANTYVMDPEHQTSFTITSPDPIDFNLTPSNVNCYDGKDGTLTINASGGSKEGYQYSLDNGNSWIAFKDAKSTKEVLTGLFPVVKPSITYNVAVKDKNGCSAKQGDNLKVLSQTISEPLSPLAVSYTFKQDPTFNGAFNGKITASISGGTIKDDKSYDYKWVKTTGEEYIGTVKYNAADKTCTISLENAPAGEYKLTVTDKNYAATADKINCSVIESSQVLTEPKPIEIALVETQAIFCNSENSETDPIKFSNGILTASVEGGTPPYQYVWSKLNTNTNIWDILDDQTASTAKDLSKGNYAVNIIDANGITQGTYDATALITAKPTTKEIIEPVKLTLLFDSLNVTCHKGNNGWAKANVAGGAAPYTYAWYNVKGGIISENEISKLTAGEYFVDVTDSKGCLIKGSVKIIEPVSAVNIEYTEITTPAFSGATNGQIAVKITGGTSFDPSKNEGKLYNYKWTNTAGATLAPTAEIINGVFTLTLSGVPADDYFLTIEDKNYNEAANQIVNCSVVESKVTLTQPDPLKVVFEIVRTISCNTNNEFGNNTDTTPKDGQRDEAQDGILAAHVTGGTALLTSANKGLPYYFYWKKQQTDGSWKNLAIQDSIAVNLSDGNYALNIKDGKGIVLGTYVNNELVQEIDVTQLMQEPPKLAITITKGDVFCKEGNDGWAAANVTGGTPPYEYKWSNEVEAEKNTVLKAGEYWVFITDAKGCTTQESVTIIEPALPLAIKYTEILNPSFYKATNGKIVVEITGGTIFSDHSYWFEWKNSKGVKQTSTTAQFNNGIYTISLNGLPEETYSLTVRDANYDAAVNKTGCTMVNAVTSLEDPDPLEVTFEIVKTISCNVNNEFGNEVDRKPQDNQRDESQDGILTAHVKGGIELQIDKNNGLPYYYTWKKKQNDGSWKICKDEDQTLENISEGTYALNIEDANGIKLGTYINNVLEKETDAVQYMTQPEKLNLTFTKFNASCNNGDDGWAEAHVTGGTAPYTYEWVNGETTAKIENITTNNYFLIVTDAKGCLVQGSIFVGDPKGILTTETVKNPTCYKGNDGSIELNVTGGNLPYSYLWNTGAATKDLNNLSAGSYDVSITCPDCCVYKKKFVLKDPNPIVIDLGKDRTLCSDQVLDLDAAVTDQNAQYNWTSTNGFTSNQPKVSLTKAGTYRVKVTSSLGCIGEDEITIKTNQAIISSEFLLSSQAYINEEVILVNTSDPFGESTNWIIPDDVTIVEQKEKYITLKFDKTGTFTIGLKQTQGECYSVYNKNITVEKRSTLPSAAAGSKFIIDFFVTPNPSNGNFKAVVNLENNNAVNLRLFSAAGEFTAQRKDSGKKKYEIDFNTSLQSGMYILVLETEQQTLVKKIIIY